MSAPQVAARQFIVTGRVQGVGYRYFVRKCAVAFALTGYAQNKADGSVAVYASGTPAALDALEAQLRVGPAHAIVKQVEAADAGILCLPGFQIR